jgi:hypothetical protein
MSHTLEYKQPSLLHHHHYHHHHLLRHHYHQNSSYNNDKNKTKLDRELGSKSNSNLLEHFKEKLNSIKKQNRLNEQLLSQSKNLLNQLLSGSNSSSNFKENSNNISIAHDKHSQTPLISRVNIDLIKYVKLKENYMQHANYWHQMWLFTDNPLCGYGNVVADLF